MYVALKVLRRDVKMVRFPSGGHEVSRSGKPSLRVERHAAHYRLVRAMDAALPG